MSGDCVRLLRRHLARYPEMQLPDFYKLVHQASMGSEHAVTDERRARSCLEQELARIGEGPEEPMLDPIRPDGAVLRVHLRPYLASGADPDRLLEAFVRTAGEVAGSSSGQAVHLRHGGSRVPGNSSLAGVQGCIPAGLSRGGGEVPGEAATSPRGSTGQQVGAGIGCW